MLLYNASKKCTPSTVTEEIDEDENEEICRTILTDEDLDRLDAADFEYKLWINDR